MRVNGKTSSHKLPIQTPSGIFKHASNCSNKDIFKRKITFQSKLWQLLNLLNLTLRSLLLRFFYEHNKQNLNWFMKFIKESKVCTMYLILIDFTSVPFVHSMRCMDGKTVEFYFHSCQQEKFQIEIESGWNFSAFSVTKFELRISASI